VYCGVRLQKFVPQEFIKTMLGLVLMLFAASLANAGDMSVSRHSGSTPAGI